jgi:two-component system chemotaxis response regulator CheB
MEITPGRVFIAPPDRHLLIEHGRMAVTRGPKENNARPAVDPLFRTAALHYGPWVIGVVLSGGLDDGTLGMMDIKRFGGLTVVQDPQDAMFPGMPSSAIENVRVDYVLPLDEIGPMVTHLARNPVSAGEGAEFMSKTQDLVRPDIAEVGSDDMVTRNMNGAPSRFTCPECGGALWELENEKLLRYRCHIGHGYTAESLMAAQHDNLEDALWSALRALEENAGMRRRMASRARQRGWRIMAQNYNQQADLAETRAGVIRSLLVEEKPSKITGFSAAALQDKAVAAVDPDAGRRKSAQPPVPKVARKVSSSLDSTDRETDKPAKRRRGVPRTGKAK